MTIFLVIVSLYGGIEKLPMNSEAGCKIAAGQFNSGLQRVAHAYCISSEQRNQ